MHGQQEKPILSLRSCCLYQTDVALFANYAWLNDACIAFYFEVLQAKADVIFRRVVIIAPEESKRQSRHCAPASLHKDGTEEKQEEAEQRESSGAPCQCAELAEERGTQCMSAAFSQSKGEEVRGQSPPTLSSGERQIIEREQNSPAEKGGCNSFSSKSQKHPGDGRGRLQEEMCCFSNSTGGKVQQSDDEWLPVLSSLIIVKPKQQPDPSNADRFVTECTGQLNSKSHVREYIPRFRTFEDRYTPILFVDPCVAFWLTFSDDEDEVTAVIQDLNLEKRHVVLWPISDKQNLSAPGGTHWTLLVQVAQEIVFPFKHGIVEARYAREGNAKVSPAQQITCNDVQLYREYKFFHLNSLCSRASPCASVAAAEQLQRQILAHVKPPHQIESLIRSTPESIKCSCPQTNSSDCGVYCLMYAEKILAVVTEWWANKAEGIPECGEEVNNREVNVSVDNGLRGRSSSPLILNFEEIQRIQPAEALAKRKGIASLIQSLRNR